jgi:protein involved in polysaccharide export with SLBB domain
MTRRVILAALVAAVLPACALPALAQTGPGWDPTGLQLTRADLEDLLARFEQTATSSAYSSTLRAQARAEAALIRQRLEEGDIRVGDRILLVVEGHEQLTDTFTVVAGRAIVLPDIGEVPLTGVLRSELQQHMTEQIRRFIRNPVVHARSLIRLEILGAVGTPGFFTIPSDMLITDALMIAGGPAGNAQMDRIRIERGRDVIWAGDRLREAVIEGRTLDQLSVRAGDSIHVPAKSGGRLGTMREVMLVVSGVASVILIGLSVF